MVPDLEIVGLTTFKNNLFPRNANSKLSSRCRSVDAELRSKDGLIARKIMLISIAVPSVMQWLAEAKEAPN